MTLNDLGELLLSAHSLDALDTLVLENRHEVRLALLNADVLSAQGLRDLDNAYSAFNKSRAGIFWERTGDFTPGIRVLLPLFALAYERSSAKGKLKSIASYLPQSSVKLRLEALAIIYNETGFSIQGHTNNFPRILDLLSLAQFEHDESATDNTNYVIRIIDILKKQGTINLANHPQELAKFTALFTREENLTRWPILIEYLENTDESLKSTTQLDVNDIALTPLSPSDIAEQIFTNKISSPLRRDARTVSMSRPLGLDFNYIREQIIETGTADFRQPHKSCSVEDKVLLYCHCNMRKHFFTSRYIYTLFIDSIPPLLEAGSGQLIFLDLGCGPLTSGLALADLYLERMGKPLPLQYIGVDIASAMLDKAKDFSTEAQLFADSEFHFFECWHDAFELVERLVYISTPIIINASYLFASSSLDVLELAAYVSQLRRHCVNAKIYFIFQNPNKSYRNVKYEEWKKHLPPFKVVRSRAANVEYYPKQFSSSSTENVYYELLAFQE